MTDNANFVFFSGDSHYFVSYAFDKIVLSKWDWENEKWRILGMINECESSLYRFQKISDDLANDFHERHEKSMFAQFPNTLMTMEHERNFI